MKILLISFILLISCSDSNVEHTVSQQCGDASLNTYTLSWDNVLDSDLKAYKVYYKLKDNTQLTKTNSNYSSELTTNTWFIDPIELSLSICDKVEFGVVAIGNTKSESILSSTLVIIID